MDRDLYSAEEVEGYLQPGGGTQGIQERIKNKGKIKDQRRKAQS
ncbi:hypothetical protein V415_21885 [Escherichia coli LAU-EC10]|nr:hypothetical protein V415_21885 [Escherichia coli LAU-EC10]